MSFEKEKARVEVLAASSAAPRTCPLCEAAGNVRYYRDAKRSYLCCPECRLVFVPDEQHLSPEAEKERYDQHQNSSADPGYRSFLGRMFDIMHAQIAPGSSGLDFGCGPEPVLARLFREAGHSVAVFDRFYEPTAAVFERDYDFIIATEVVEHLRHPLRELDRLWGRLRIGGMLGIMTRPVVPPAAFGSWHYKNDMTHICFFSPDAFRWLARRWNALLAFPQGDIALFRKR